MVALAWVPRGFPLLVHVVEGWRRRGIGRALLAAAAASVNGETQALRAWAPLEEGRSGALFLQASGFQVTRRLLAFEIGDLACIAAVGALLRRVQDSGRVPADVRMVLLGDAPAADIVRLVAPQFAALPYEVAQRIASGTQGGYDPALSLVLLRGDRVAGVMLCRRLGDVAEVDVSVVAPEMRHGWAYLMLVNAIGHRAYEAGLRCVRFACEEHVRDVVNVARRTGATCLPPQLVLTLALQSAAAA